MKKSFTLCATIFVLFIVACTMRDIHIAHAAATTTTATATSNAALQKQIDANDQQINDLNQKIAMYQVELQQVGANKKTLNAAINALNLQRNEVETRVAVTQRQINSTRLQIQQLGGEIMDTQQTIANDQVALSDNLRNLQKAENQTFLMQMFSADTLVQIWSNINATLQVQNGVQNAVNMLRSQENDLADSRTTSKQKQSTLTSQQQSLTSQQQSLAQTVQSKNQLLAETNAEESTYEKLLAAAQAELKSFSTFSQNAGGSKLLANQTVCDAWGCYYNQRDTAWGNDSLNGTQFNLASDGCLVASMAMAMTHYGYRDVTPVTINANPNNFAAYYPASLLITINVDGVSATRKAATINATLATGNPVIIGLRAYGGTHFVVLISHGNGDYVMRDPYIPNGKDISFSAHYSLKKIFSIAKVIIS